MKIRDIVNKDAASISNCESEPIHIPGSIQPHGALLALHPQTFLITHCSANTEAFLGRTPERLLGRPVSEVLGTHWPGLEELLREPDLPRHPCTIGMNGRVLDVLMHRTGNAVFLELERQEDSGNARNAIFDQTARFVTLIGQARSLQDLCQKIAVEVRGVTGYDRVMVYRFDRNYNGEVYAESRHPEVDSFLGLYYPHTDIPVQARELYLRNLMRHIADVSYLPVPILMLDDGKEETLDLGVAQLRSVSPIHIQYLKNMEVGATLTISLVQDGRLWGLIACHHRQPKHLSYEQRQAALLQGHFLSSQIRVRQVAEEYEISVVVEAHLQQLLHKLDAEEEFRHKFEQFTSLNGLVNASGVVILHNGELFEKGLVPPREKTLELIRWIDENIRSVQFSTSFLGSRYFAGKEISGPASGILYHALGKPTENCIIWFREEVERTINWAGNPNEAVLQDRQSKALTPRSSFAVWKESVRWQSREWRAPEINAATRFATALQNHFHLVHLRHEEFRLRVLNESLQKANAELSNISWISSHDLKEPLRKIQMFASRIVDAQNEDVSEMIRKSVERIQKSAGRMQQLVDAILSYSLTSYTDEQFALTDLNAVISEALHELDEEFTAKGVQVHTASLPRNVRAVGYQMHQLFANLLANSLKFAYPGRPLEIRVSCRKETGKSIPEVTLPRDKEYYAITMEDNGIGFNAEYSQRIFNIFYRLHNPEEYQGTGIGLAICKKILENHQGTIVASGTEGKGAKFTFYLPVP